MKKFIILMFFICIPFFASAKTVHVNVALCDNIHQRIYPVPYKLGKGDDPENNLYWGAMYGVKTFFKNSKDWIFVEEKKDVSKEVLRRVVFKHKDSDTWLVADAYLGKKIRPSIKSFINYSAGKSKETMYIEYKEKKIELNIGGGADLVAYVGHNGLMDFDIKNTPEAKSKKDIIILACYSKSYFKDIINGTGANPILWTSSKMAPEAYVLKAAIEAWIKKENSRDAAINAYAKYQKISKKAATSVFAVQ